MSNNRNNRKWTKTMADKKEELSEKLVCKECGLIHEKQIPIEEARKDDLKIVGLSIMGIVMIAFIWVWVFKWGVPLVKHISGTG